MQVVGLGRGKQNAVDARTDQRAEQRAPSDAEAFEDRRHRGFEVMQGIGAGVEGGERVDQHDLAIEPCEVIAEERAHDDALVGFEASPHHRPQRARGRLAVRWHPERCKGQRRRAGHRAGQQETPGRQQAHGKAFVAAGHEVFGEQSRRGQRVLFVGALIGLQRRKMRVPA